jgi:two-component system nitrogen regulation response regulator NtrX
MESELFGHEAGAFTGATRRKQGRVEAAGDGVVFFDEIGELDPGAQAKLLRLLEQKEYERVGGVRTLTTEARVLAATNRDLEALVEDGLFREDLFYRLDALRLNVPDLAQREGDIPLLVDHFLERVRLEMKGPRKSFSEAALAACEAHGWPGNVRELRNVVQSAAILAPGEVIEVEHLGGRVRRAAGNADETRRVGSAPAPGERVPESARELEQARRLAADEAARAVERAFLERLLQRHGGNISRAAREAGLDRSNLHRMMKRTGLA